MVNNLDIGVKRALLINLTSRGKSAGAAEAAASSRLSAAMTYIQSAYQTRKSEGPTHIPDARHWAGAFQDLKTWAAANIP
jgi:hypothetical protein